MNIDFPKYISNEIKKTENKFNIKKKFDKLKLLDRKKIIKDELQFEIKPVSFDYVPDKKDVVDFFQEKETNKFDFFKNNISNSLKDNLYLKYISNNAKESDEKKNIYNNLIDEILVQKEKDENEKKNKKSKPKKSENSLNNFDFYKYYKIHREKAEKFKKSSSYQNILKNNYAEIFPNYDYIRKRIITAPKWQKISNKKKSNNQQDKTTSSITTFNNITHLFDNTAILAKSFRTQNNFGKFINQNPNNKNKIDKIDIISKISSENLEKQLKYKKIDINMDKIPKISRTKKLVKKPNKSKSFSYMNKSQENLNKFIKKINQYIFNENKKKFINYDFAKERVKMMVNYNLKRDNKIRVKAFKGCENEEFMDPLKSFKKMKGNKYSGINFDKMASRDNNKVLPSFMSGIHSRLAFDFKTDESLKMNNYSTGRFSTIKDSLIPKSFNKYVNLSLLKSENVKPEDVFNLSEFIYLANNLLPEIE